MAEKNIQAGAEVERGTYRCNACANEYEAREAGEKLPPCEACSSISWRVYRLVDDSKRSKDGR